MSGEPKGARLDKSTGGDLMPTEAASTPTIRSGLFVALATEPFLRFKNGEKTVELRNNPRRWRKAVTGRPVLLRRGYNTKDELRGTVGRTCEVADFEGLPGWARDGAGLYGFAARFIRCDLPIYAFEVLDAK